MNNKIKLSILFILLIFLGTGCTATTGSIKTTESSFIIGKHVDMKFVSCVKKAIEFEGNKVTKRSECLNTYEIAATPGNFAGCYPQELNYDGYIKRVIITPNGKRIEANKVIQASKLKSWGWNFEKGDLPGIYIVELYSLAGTPLQEKLIYKKAFLFK